MRFETHRLLQVSSCRCLISEHLQFCSFGEKKLFPVSARENYLKETSTGVTVWIQSTNPNSIPAPSPFPPAARGQTARARFLLLTFNLPNRTEVLLKSVIEFGISDGFKVTGINSASRSGETTFAHTGVVPQPALVQVGVS